MEAPQTLRPPANWQDFESLCKRLWGEIWNCPEIQKNGRLGQEQSGVDIFGIPFGEDGYYGIQCKGKSQYSNSQFTQNEILEEIEKAKSFEPALKKLYLATTAVNDSKIQSFVRQKNLEHKSNGLFEVHLFCWETIVDLIDSNKQTHEWYVKNQNYKTRKGVSITFENGLTEVTCSPKFKQSVLCYVKESQDDIDAIYSNPVFNFGKQFGVINSPYNSIQINESYFCIDLHIKNTGTEAIEEYKVFLEFQGEIQDLKDTNRKEPFSIFHKSYPNTSLWADSMTGRIIPKKSILVSDDTLISEDIFVKPHPKESQIIIKWKLISKDFKDVGELIVHVIPEIKKNTKYRTVDDSNEERIEPGEFSDYIIHQDKK